MKKRGRDRDRIDPLANIHRDRDAWTVCIIREGKYYWGHFAFDTYGGRAKALVAAKRHRDECLLGVPPDTRVRKRKPRGAPRKPPKVGVSIERYLVDGKEYERFVACWVDADGTMRRRRFNVGTRSRESARALAIAARDEGVALARRLRAERQREEASRRLAKSGSMPPQVKDPASRKGIKMPPRGA